MIARVLHVARREGLEQRRQPVMLAVITTLYSVVGGSMLVVVGALRYIAASAEGTALLATFVPEDPARLVGSALSLYVFLIFTQYLGIAAVCCGHAMLHERQCGTLTFLLLAPLGRGELLIGKVLGAIGWSTALYVAVNAPVLALMCLSPEARSHAAWLPLSSPFWVAFWIGAPAWAFLVGGICTLVSASARDVRTAQQGTWFVVFFASLLAGSLLTWALTAGLAAELAVAALAITGSGAVIATGSTLLSRDLGR